MDPMQVGLPCNLDAERFVLGAALTGAINFVDLRGELAAEDFSVEKHRRIWGHMCGMYERGDGIDRVTLINALQNARQLESVDGFTYIASLDDGMPSLVNAGGYARIVREKSMLRRTILQCQGLIDRCLLQQDAPAEVLADAEKAMRQLGGDSSRDADQMQNFREILADCGDMEGFGSVPAPGVALPYPGLQRALDGVRPGELIILGARPSSGKSAMAAEIALFAAEAGHGCAFFSLEVGGRAMLTRAVANRAQIDSRSIRRGRLTPIERNALQASMGRLVKLPFWVNVKARTADAIHAATRKQMSKSKVELVVVDHLHLLSGNSRKQDNRNRELGQMTADLKTMAGELGVSVLLLSQMNRSHETDKRPPEMRDLRESGDIEANADVILFLHRKEQIQNEADKGAFVPVDLILAKQREGATFMKYQMLLYGKYAQFVEEEQDQGRRTA